MGRRTVTDRTRYIWQSRVLKVEERFEIGISIGWFIQINPEVSIRLGVDKPDLKEGDLIEHSIIKLSE